MIEQLLKLIKPMNLPEYRKQKTTPSNLKWLYKNLEIYNKNHKNYTQAMELLKHLTHTKKP